MTVLEKNNNYNRFAGIIALFLCLFMTGCASLIGDHQLTRMDAVSGGLEGAWLPEDKYKKLDKKTFIKKGESLTIVFDNAYLQDLPDLGQSNEVVVIFEFEELDQKLTKILGPIEHTADKSYFNEIASVVYGPKDLEDDFIKVTITVMEIDIDENEEIKSFIDFIKTVAEPFSLANPLTTAEMELTAEIAKTLVNFNKNDVVVSFSFTLSAYSEDVESNWLTIPLTEGTYGLIQTIKIRKLDSEYFHFTDKNYQEKASVAKLINPVAWVADIILMPVVAFNVLTDTPSYKSKEDLSVSDGSLLIKRYKDSDEIIGIDPKTRRLVLWREIDPDVKEAALAVQSSDEKFKKNDFLLKGSQLLQSGKSPAVIKSEMTTLIKDSTDPECNKNCKDSFQKTLNKDDWIQTLEQLIYDEQQQNLRKIYSSITDRKIMLRKYSELYQDKSWIIFSIQKGNDTTNWDLRKSLRPSEKRINELIQQKTISETIDANLGDLAATVQKIQKQNRKKRTHIAPKEQKQNANNDYEFSIYLPKMVQEIYKITFFGPGEPVDLDPVKNAFKKVPSSNEKFSQFIFAYKNKLDPGVYNFLATDKKTNAYLFEFKIIEAE